MLLEKYCFNKDHTVRKTRKQKCKLKFSFMTLVSLISYLLKCALSCFKQLLAIESPLKMMEKCCLIYLKISSCSQDI